MKVRLGTRTGSTETGTDVSGIYWNDTRGYLSGVSFIDYTDKKGRARRIWPDSDILHIQSIKLQLDDEQMRLMSAFTAQRSLKEDKSSSVLQLQVNGKAYNVFDARNARWDAARSTLRFLRNSGPMPGRINRGDYATVELRSPEESLSKTNSSEELSVLIPRLAPVTTCDVTMKAGWRDRVNASATDADRGYVLLYNEAGAVTKEVAGQYSVPSKKKKRSGGSPSFWAGEETVRGITYNGMVKTQGPVGKCSVTVKWPAYQASFTVRVVEVVIA